MNFAKNTLLKSGNGDIIRILYVNRITSIVYVINVEQNNWPYPIKLDELISLQTSGEVNILNEDTYCRTVLEEELTEIEKRKRDNAWEIVSFLFSQVQDEEHLFLSKYRREAIKVTTATFRISYNTAKNYLLRYWKGGQIVNSLIPMFANCGAKGRDRATTGNKRGRPRLDNIQGINIDENIKAMFRTGLNRYYYNKRQNSLRTAFELTLRDFFTKKEVDQNGLTFPILLDSRPTYNQFVYWYKRFNNTKKEVSKRNGTRVFQQEFRTIIGSSTQDAGFPSAVFQIDSTICDVHLISSFNRDLIVGRPILFLVIDVYSRYIVGMNISFESINSYAGAMTALANSMTSKKEYCGKYGIQIDDNDWVFSVPERVLSDRGELVNPQISNAIRNLGIAVQNTPPYHADYKGVIEQAFHQMNLRLKPFADGVVVNGKSKIERGDSDYRLQATLTIEEFTRIVIKCILFYNNHHVLADYVLDEKMLQDGVEKIPRKLWEHGIGGKGQLRILPEEVIRTHLLPSEKATVTSRGVAFKGMLYASDFALRNNWFQTARAQGTWRVKISYSPLDMTHIYFVDEHGGEIHELTLLEHLSQFSGKSIDEIEVVMKHQKERDKHGKEKELKEKIRLFDEIEHIVKEARLKTESEKDVTKSKTQRLQGIKDNQRQERLLQREKASKVHTSQVESVETQEQDIVEPIDDELELFRQLQFQSWGDNGDE